MLLSFGTGSPPFQRLEKRFDIVERGKDRSFSFDVLSPCFISPPTQFHISMQKVHERAIFPSIFADLLESHTSPSSFLPRNVCVYVCVCVSTWNGGIWSKRRGSANKYKAIKLVFLRNEIVIGSSSEKYFSFGKNSLGIFLPSLEDR